MSESPERYTGSLPEGVDSSAPPPAAALEPLVGGQRTPPGVFTLVEFRVTRSSWSADLWVVRAVWQLAEDFPHPVVVDGALLTMGGEAYPVPFAETRVRPGELLGMNGPTIAWRPEVLAALRDLERRGQ